MNKLFLSPNETLSELGTKEQFEESRCMGCSFREACQLDEDGDDLLGDKLRAEHQSDMEDDMKEMLEENGLDEFDI